MGVEPTVACSAQPTTSFEDWGTHRGTTTPTHKFISFCFLGVFATKTCEALTLPFEICYVAFNSLIIRKTGVGHCDIKKES